MHRRQMIEALVIDNLVNILDRECFFRLHGIRENGYRVFARMSNGDLRAEIARRGLGPDANGSTTEEVEHWTEDDVDADMHCLALSGLERDRRDARTFETD